MWAALACPCSCSCLVPIRSIVKTVVHIHSKLLCWRAPFTGCRLCALAPTNPIAMESDGQARVTISVAFNSDGQARGRGDFERIRSGRTGARRPWRFRLHSIRTDCSARPGPSRPGRRRAESLALLNGRRRARAGRASRRVSRKCSPPSESSAAAGWSVPAAARVGWFLVAAPPCECDCKRNERSEPDQRAHESVPNTSKRSDPSRPPPPYCDAANSLR